MKYEKLTAAGKSAAGVCNIFVISTGALNEIITQTPPDIHHAFWHIHRPWLTYIKLQRYYKIQYKDTENLLLCIAFGYNAIEPSRKCMIHGQWIVHLMVEINHIPRYDLMNIKNNNCVEKFAIDTSYHVLLDYTIREKDAICQFWCGSWLYVYVSLSVKSSSFCVVNCMNLNFNMLV